MNKSCGYLISFYQQLVLIKLLPEAGIEDLL